MEPPEGSCVALLPVLGQRHQVKVGAAAAVVFADVLARGKDRNALWKPGTAAGHRTAPPCQIVR
eukprot:11154554-Alexandrium_andersonii.AAC.1